MAVRLVIEIEALDGMREKFRQTYVTLCPEVRKEPGCIEYEMHQSLERPDNFVMLERWADEEALATHFALLQTRGLGLDNLRRYVSMERYIVD